MRGGGTGENPIPAIRRGANADNKHTNASIVTNDTLSDPLKSALYEYQSRRSSFT
jgi:hypothetical protein